MIEVYYAEDDEVIGKSVKEYLDKGMSPADVIIKKWNGVWNKDLRKMINYLTQGL